MSAFTAESNATHGIRSSPESLLTRWSQEWNEVPFFKQTGTPFRFCPSLEEIACAASQEDLKTASAKVLTTIEGWESPGRRSQSCGRPSSVEVTASGGPLQSEVDAEGTQKTTATTAGGFMRRRQDPTSQRTPHVTDDEDPPRPSRNKAYRVLGVPPPSTNKGYRVLGVPPEDEAWITLAELTPHVRNFVKAKTQEMERFLAEQPSEASARQS